MSFDVERIESLLRTEEFGRSLDVRDRTGSTNDDARDAVDVPHGHVVLADSQDAGRGARGARWESPAGTDLYFSIVLSGAGLEVGGLPPLTLAVGLGVVHACEGLVSAELSIKWPNDVVFEGLKCAGILVESISVGPRLARVIIGVGLDVNRKELGALDGVATSLARIAGRLLDREVVFAATLREIEKEVGRFIARGASAVVPRVDTRLAWKGREVVCDGVRGRLVGLRGDGALRIEGPAGETAVVSGTLRPA